MTTLRNCVLSATIATSLVCAGCITNNNNLETPLPASGLAFTEATIILEHNATDGDAEIVLFVKGGDEGLAQLTVYAPAGTVILDSSTQEKAVGLREFTVESAEPGVAEIIGAYPEGAYRFEGVTVSGIRLHATAYLSHALPDPPVIKVDKTAATVTWSSVAGTASYSLELEQEVDGEDIMKLTIDLPATVQSFSIPKAFQVPGDYQVGVAVHGETGNIVVAEQEFSIGQ